MQKRIIGKAIPKSGSKKKKQPSISTLKKKLWTVFSLYIRKRDKGICFTCGRYAEGSGYHAGHFVPKSVGGLALYFHEENVRGQCYNCNINLGGSQYIYGQKLGDRADYLYSLKGKTEKWTAQDYLDKIKHYGNLLRQM